MANNNWIWIIAVILALIFIVPNLMKKESANFTTGTIIGLTNCNTYLKQTYINQGAICVGDCVPYSQQIALCLGYNDYVAGKYISFGDYRENCNSLTGNGKTAYQCIYGSTTCTPSCSGKTCGDNGCGGSCGTCETSQDCISGECVINTVVDCLTDDDCESGEKCENGDCIKVTIDEEDNEITKNETTCEWYQDVDNDCNTATWVWIIGGIVLVMLMLIMMGGKRRRR